MKSKIITILFALFFNISLFAQMKQFDIDLYDTHRHRAVPVAIYAPETISNQEVVIFNHGYNKNTGTPYKDYSYLTERLAREGYFVISIQHELPDDELLAMEGNLYETRMPNWERGVQNILFVLQEMKRQYPALK